MILGKISSYESGNGVALIIDGEETPTTKEYLFLDSYQVHVGDRVLVEEFEDTYVVLGAVVKTNSLIHASYADNANYANRAGSVTGSVVASGVKPYSDSSTTIQFTVFNGNLWVKQGNTQWALAKG